MSDPTGGGGGAGGGGGGTVALGVLVGLLSACVQSVGLTLQRKSHLLEEQKQEESYGHIHRPAYRRRRWQVGMVMFLISNIVGSTIQITTLPLPVLSALQASGLVFNTICATLLLGEPFTRFSLVGTLLVAAGAVLIGIFGAMTEPSHNLEQLLDLLGRRQFILWLSGTFAIVLVVLVLIWIQERVSRRPHHRTRLLLGMGYGSISGILSAHCLLLAKSAVELVVRTIAWHHNQFNRWQSWMILLGLVVLALSQLYYLHRGLKLCSTSVLYPFVFCVYNIIAILDGLIYFRQTSRLPVVHAALIAVGTVVLLSGVFALSWRLDPEYTPSSSTTLDGHPQVAPVPTTQSALTPGLGIVEPVTTEQADEHVRPGSAEHVPEPGGVTPFSRFRRHSSKSPSELSPLLPRTRTNPSPPTWRLSSKRRSLGLKRSQQPELSSPESSQHMQPPSMPDSTTRRTSSSPSSPSTRFALRPPKFRRITPIKTHHAHPPALESPAVEAEDASDLWEELNNDRSQSTRHLSGVGPSGSGGTGLASSPQLHRPSTTRIPSSSRSRRRRAGTLPASSMTANFNLNNLPGRLANPFRSIGMTRWPSWGGVGGVGLGWMGRDNDGYDASERDEERGLRHHGQGDGDGDGGNGSESGAETEELEAAEARHADATMAAVGGHGTSASTPLLGGRGGRAGGLERRKSGGWFRLKWWRGGSGSGSGRGEGDAAAGGVDV